jgi:hypothetical protein
MTQQEKLLSAVGLTVLTVVILLAFSAYLGSGMQMDYASIRLCS